MLIPEAGMKLKHIPTGIPYEVKRITGQFVILFSLDGLSQILVEKKNLPSFFESEKVLRQSQPKRMRLRIF